MAMMNESMLQALRTIDKVDRLGVDGVRALLVKPLGGDDFGAGLQPWQAEILCRLLDLRSSPQATIIPDLMAYLRTVDRVAGRIRLMAVMEGLTVQAATVWDHLLAMPGNVDNTWGPDGKSRPANIGWALDDIIAWLDDAEEKPR